MNRVLFFLAVSIASSGIFSNASNLVLDVPGMVCQMCVQGMEKTFGKKVTNASDGVAVNLDSKFVVLNDLKKEFRQKKLLKKTKNAIQKGLKPLESSVDAGYEADIVVYDARFKNGFSKTVKDSDIVVVKGAQILLNFGKDFEESFAKVVARLGQLKEMKVSSKDNFEKRGKRKVLYLEALKEIEFKQLTALVRTSLGDFKLASGV